MEILKHGSVAFGVYIGILILLRFLLPPLPQVADITPGVNSTQAAVIDFFGTWIYRGTWAQDAIFLAILVGILFCTSFLCPPNRHIALIGTVFFLGTFFHLYLHWYYQRLFFNVILTMSLQIIVNAIILLVAGAGWSALISRRLNPKTPPPQDQWVTVLTTCPQCGTCFKSNPQYCSMCSTQLRD